MSIPLNGKCDKEGNFHITGVPPGRRELRVHAKWLVVNRTFPVPVNPGVITAVTLVVSEYGMIHGQVKGVDPVSLARMLVTIEGFGIAAKPDAYGYYFLDRVPPGDWVINLDMGNGQFPIRHEVAVAPMRTTKGVDFIFAPTANAPKTPDTPTATFEQKQTQGQPKSKVMQMAPTGEETPISVPDVSGQWKSSIGLTYNLTQQQDRFQWTVMNSDEKGEEVVQGGSNISASWQGQQGSGSSAGKITAVDSTGRATQIEWDNGVRFYR